MFHFYEPFQVTIWFLYAMDHQYCQYNLDELRAQSNSSIFEGTALIASNTHPGAPQARNVRNCCIFMDKTTDHSRKSVSMCHISLTHQNLLTKRLPDLSPMSLVITHHSSPRWTWPNLISL